MSLSFTPLPGIRRAALDRLIYFSELPVAVDEARWLLGASPTDAPPARALCIDFGPLTPAGQAAVEQWMNEQSRQPLPGAARVVIEPGWPNVVYLFAWPAVANDGDDRHLRRLVDAVEHSAHAALGRVAPVDVGGPPWLGLSHHVTEWPDLRRGLTRATVASRLSWLQRRVVTCADEADAWLEQPRAKLRSSAALLAALARHDREASLAEARRTTDSLVRALVSPLAILRLQLARLLFECGEVGLNRGLTEHQIARWVDHRLRRLWQVYSLPLLASVAVEAVAELVDILADLDDPTLPRSVAAARSLLAATWNEDLSAAQLAREAGTSPAYLSRLFKQHVGCSIPAYRNQLRIERAARLLQTTDKPINEIAFECGFSSVTHFNRMFRRHHRQTPSGYRQQGG